MASASSSSPVLIDEAMAELAAADALGAGLQGADRHHHAPRQQRAGQGGDQQAQHQQGERAQAGIDDGLLRLDRRHLDEDQPFQRRDLGVGGEHRDAGEVRGVDLAVAGLGRGERRRHLRQALHVGAAQHQRDVGMRHQPALRADDIGVAVLADLDLRDDVPDQLEVDLGHGDAAAPAMGHRHGQVRLGFLAEVDRPEIHAVGHRLR